MRKTEIRVERAEEFFARGRRTAELADRGSAIRPSRVVAFEDVETLLSVLTPKRVLLLREIKAAPASISELARRVRRDRSVVTRDVQVLERHGVIQVSERPLPGHGRQKWIAPVGDEIELVATF